MNDVRLAIYIGPARGWSSEDYRRIVQELSVLDIDAQVTWWFSPEKQAAGKGYMDDTSDTLDYVLGVRVELVRVIERSAGMVKGLFKVMP